MIVVDTNVVVYFWVPGQRTADAERVFARDPEWAVPLLWRSEFHNVLTTGVRQKQFSLSDAIGFSDAARSQLRGRELPVDSEQVLRLAHDSRCSADDCEFVALARRLNVMLVTDDRQVLRAFHGIAFSLEEYAPTPK